MVFCKKSLNNILFNIILIPIYGATGAAISTLFAEFLVLLLQIILGNHYYP
ncbi:MAG: polysaccharide biosynthesis C-terminal domain-containing protein, partial [Clostridia bacterium]|nr:polysaccharide biosynthesis C-terminal domain-containing protein [Clostridia bacterium]